MFPHRVDDVLEHYLGSCYPHHVDDALDI
ncbi:hypothetical protein SAI_1129, partial [Streptococcus agalactiae H36B]